MDLSRTSELRVKKVCLVKVSEKGELTKERVMGLEWGVPTRGASYVVYLGEGRFLKTTPIKEIKEIHNAVMFKTVNSVYRIEYGKGKQ
jgi:hypothetical protein